MLQLFLSLGSAPNCHMHEYSLRAQENTLGTLSLAIGFAWRDQNVHFGCSLPVTLLIHVFQEKHTVKTLKPQ